MNLEEEIKKRDELVKLLSEKQRVGNEEMQKIQKEFIENNPVAKEVNEVNKKIEEIDKALLDYYGINPKFLSMPGLKKFIEKVVEDFLKEGPAVEKEKKEE